MPHLTPPNGRRPVIVPCGDRAAMIQYPGGIDPRVNGWVRSTARLLRGIRHPALDESVIAYATLLVEYDPVQIAWVDLSRLLAEVVDRAERVPPPPGQRLEVPVVYGGDDGPDLAEVAELRGLTPDEFVRRHANRDYLVYCLGFSPGYAYLGGLDPALAVPRLDSPRTRVPAGAVGIGGHQTGIYPSESPGGWRLLGRTTLRLFDPERNPPCLIAPGDTIVFRPVRELPPVSPPLAAAPQAPAAGTGGLEVLQPGLGTTIQDLGRRGLRDWGVPVSGAADPWSLAVGNWLVGNADSAAALELTLLGGDYRFTTPAAFCITGATFSATLQRAGGGTRALAPWTVATAAAGDVLRCAAAVAGCRGYLCVAGGIAVSPVLGSRSVDTLGALGPLGGRPLRAGDRLPIGPAEVPPLHLAGRALPPAWRPDWDGRYTLRVVMGPQAEAFTPAGLAAFRTGTYVVGHQSDRVGVRLNGPAIGSRSGSDILTEGMPLGGIQVPNSGQPIMMLAGHQATGGYAKVAVTVSTDMPVAAQLRPGDQVSFQVLDLAAAHTLAKAATQRLESLRRDLSPASAGSATAFAHRPETVAPGRSPVRTLRVRIGDTEFIATVEEEEPVS